MKTVSVDTARKLKDAGLVWEPKKGDWYSALEPPSYGEEEYYLEEPFLVESGSCEPWKQDIWLPTLDDLLEWLEQRGYWWNITIAPEGNQFGKYCGMVCKVVDTQEYKNIWANIPVEVAAKAMLWVLEQEGKHAEETVD